ncbi:hypothetical protein BDN70DRAFT_871586 [Pholiota conissans]|uniref:Zn(2)-C6 fungal-type domain-containing protein n=1 Tax=Pholiota conissans TaxID=109636 RepID=A0A9P5ZBU3_9AGAR|nr:hypothetical protein BDN70DRAFT_871586 [Pholiota conissans]
MSNPYNQSQRWNQNQMNFGPLQLEQEYEYSSVPVPGNGQQQVLGGQQSYASDEAYQYSQQRLPQTNVNANPNASSVHNPFAIPPNAQQSRNARMVPSQAPAVGGYGHGVYGAQQSLPSGTAEPAGHYRPNSMNFNFSGAGAAMQNVDATRSPPGFLTSSPLQHDSFLHASTSTHQQPYYQSSIDGHTDGPQKRQRGHAFKDDTEDQEGDIGQDQKDAKSKLSRACARCKTLKVRCEAKTETEPCKRCFNGGHECVIPGRKIRRTPPKREHLLSQIQSQAAEIERLIQELEKVTLASKSGNGPDKIDTSALNTLQSPVLSPSTAPGPFFGADEHPTDDYAQVQTGTNDNNPVVNKAVEDWIAKARESLHEFGNFIGIGGAGMPKSYLVDEDFEDSDSDDDDYDDAQEELEQLGNGDDQYALAVEDPNGEGRAYDGTATPNQQPLRHQSSNSSIGTTMTGATAGTASTNAMPRPKKIGNNESYEKPAILPAEASPFGMFGHLILKGGPKSRASSVEPDEEDKPGIANADFFKSTPAPNALGRRLESAQHQAPAILTRGIISPQEAEKLFKIYFNDMNLSVSLLDPVLYTAQRTFYRSPFLFTVICAIASRFYSERPDLYAKIMHYAQLAAGTALIGGNKNVEMCQAYILLSLYPVPARKWEDQRSWLYLGLAIRTATDLNLHLPTTAKPLNENHAREMLNRTRVWLNCLNLDRSTGSQYGKPPIISPKDYIANHSERWWTSSPYNMKNFDIHTCAYNSELKLMSAFIAKIYSDPDHPTGLNKMVDFEQIATETDDELKKLGEEWFAVLAQTDMTDPQNSFRTGLLRLAYSYSRLVALSYGFQHAFGKTDGVDENPFLMRCLRAASDVVDAVVHDICRPSQIHYFRHGPEAQSVFVTFASAFLVKLLQPRFAAYLTLDTRKEIRVLVQKVIDLLGSPEVAIDDRHGPKLYSRFLEKLLAKPMARIDPLSPGPASNALPRVKSRPPRSSASQTPDSASGTFDLPPVYNHPSPGTNSSLSPPPTESALSFDSFAPIGPTDPFATETEVANNNADSASLDNMMSTDFFQPPLPFDDHIVQSLRSLTDPSGWQDISVPEFNWMTQFQQNMFQQNVGLDLNNSNPLFDQNMEYLTGPANQ